MYTLSFARGIIIINQMAQVNNQSAEFIANDGPLSVVLQKPVQERTERLQPVQIVLKLEPEPINDDGQPCQVCCVLVNSNNIKIFNKCGHQFCVNCLNKHIQSQMSNYRIVKCLTQNCPQRLQADSQHIKALSESIQQRYYKIMVFQNLSKEGNIKLCPTEECDGFITINDKLVNCAICNTTFCGNCFLKMHKGDCDKNGVIYAEDNFKYRQCRKCKMVLEKTEGCDHMTCRCGHQFCYLCGGKWSYDHKCPIKLNIKRFFQCMLIFTLIILVISVDLVWAVFMLVCFPIGISVVIFFMALVKGTKTMIQQLSCKAIILGNIFLVLVYTFMTFVSFMKQFFSYDIWKCWRRQRLLPISYLIWNGLTNCFGLYQPLN